MVGVKVAVMYLCGSGCVGPLLLFEQTNFAFMDISALYICDLVYPCVTKH